MKRLHIFLITLTTLTTATFAADPSLLLDLATPPAGSVTRYFGSVGEGTFGVPVCGGWDCDGDGKKDAAFSSMVGTPFERPRAGFVTWVLGDGKWGREVDTLGFREGLIFLSGDQVLEATGSEVWMDDVNGDGLGDLLIGRQNHSPLTSRRGAGAVTVVLGSPELRAFSKKKEAFDLRQPPKEFKVITIFGASNYDRLGIWLRTGDVDGDGVADVAIGADEVDTRFEFNRGAAYVLRGGAHWNATQTIDLAKENAGEWKGKIARVFPPLDSQFTHFGATVALADLNNNGKAELLVAATLNRGGARIRLLGAPSGVEEAEGGVPRGQAYIVWDDLFASDKWKDQYVIDLDPKNKSLTILTGGRQNANFGEEMLSGDFDGDGKADLFVGDLGAANVNGLEAGRGHVFFGAAGLKGRLLSLALPLPADVVMTDILGPLGAALGADAAGVGDFDGDGLDDIAFANPHDTIGTRLQAGTIHVLYGRRGAWPKTVDLGLRKLPEAKDLRSAYIVAAGGHRNGDRADTLGYSLAVGDWDGDGRDDIITNEMLGNRPDAVDVGNLLLINGAKLLAPPPKPAITSFGLTEGKADLRLPTAEGSRYRIERSADLRQWGPVGDVIQGDGKAKTYVESLHPSGRGFFRVVLLP